MVRPDRDRLKGRVEVDETFTGGVEEGTPGRHTGRKTLIVIAAQEDGPGIGRIRMRRIPDASVDSLTDFITEAIEPGSTVHTDGWRGYAGVEVAGYDHEVTLLRGKKQTASELMPRVHRVASLLKRHPPGGLRVDVFWCTTSGDLRVCCQHWLMGTHQGAVTREHLDYYLDEFTFRFNRRRSANRGSSSIAWCNRPSPLTRHPTNP